MDIKTKLNFITKGLVVMFIIMGVSLSWAYFHINRALINDEYVAKTLIIISSLTFQLHHALDDNRTSAVKNFGLEQKRLNEHLKNKPDVSPIINSLVTKIEKRNKSILALLSQLKRIENEKNLVISKHLVDKLLIQVNAIREDSIRISLLSKDEIKDIIFEQVIGITSIMIVTIILLSISLTKIFYIIKSSLGALINGSIIAGDGNFEQPIIGLGNDEFGVVATHFNKMLKKLSDTTASKDSLQKLVNERTKKLQEISETDPLTKIHNRRFYDQQLTSNIASEKRMGTTLSLLMIDIDFFKRYNDSYGHDMGDITLTRVAQTIEETLPRATDSVSRYGGEEFVVLLPSTNKDGAFIIAERIRTYVKAMSISHDSSPEFKVVTVSIGISSLNGDELNEIDLLKQADIALYQSKENGRNQSIVFKE